MMRAAKMQTDLDRKPSPSSPDDTQAGITMVELLVVLCIMGVISVLIVGLMAKLRRSYTTQSVVSDVQESTRAAIDYISNDIRMAGYDPLNMANAGIENMTATSLRITSDRNANGEIENLDRERVSFVYDVPNQRLQQILYEGTASAMTDILISNVTGVTFSYFNQDGNVTTDPEEVRTVEILLAVEQLAARDDPVQRTYTTRVKCRNIGL
jgi:type IV pilus assembly protein PilW